MIFKGEAERAERRWREMGQADKALLTGLDLARAEEWLPNRQEDLSAQVSAYVQRSIAYDRAAKERQLKFQRRVTIGAIAAALLMAVIGVFAGWQWKDAAVNATGRRQPRNASRQRGTAPTPNLPRHKQPNRASWPIWRANDARRATPARLSCSLLRGFPTTRPGLPDAMSPKQNCSSI